MGLLILLLKINLLTQDRVNLQCFTGSDTIARNAHTLLSLVAKVERVAAIRAVDFICKIISQTYAFNWLAYTFHSQLPTHSPTDPPIHPPLTHPFTHPPVSTCKILCSMPLHRGPWSILQGLLSPNSQHVKSLSHSPCLFLRMNTRSRQKEGDFLFRMQ